MQGEEVMEREMDIQPFREYTNEKLWCPLKENIVMTQSVRTMGANKIGIKTLQWTSEVILSGEKVNFDLWVDVPDSNSKLKNTQYLDYAMRYGIYSTSNRIEVDYYVLATTKKDSESFRRLYGSFAEDFEKYKKIAVKVVNYLRGLK
jgi:hypothetical protein